MQWKMSAKKRSPINWKRTDGTPGTAENVTATSSDENVVKTTVVDGFVVYENVAPGKATVTVSGDTDPSDGVRPVSASADVEILSDDTADTVAIGDPEDQPA